jgi:hypothetical protein
MKEFISALKKKDANCIKWSIAYHYRIYDYSNFKKWLIENKLYDNLFDKAADFTTLLEYCKNYRHIIEDLHKIQDTNKKNKYNYIFEDIVANYPYSIKQNYTKTVKPHGIYTGNNGILLILANLDGCKQFILYDTNTRTVQYGQCLKNYHIRMSHVYFDGKYIKYRITHKHKYEMGECKSLAPNFTTIENGYHNVADAWSYKYEFNSNYDIYDYDLNMLSFVQITPITNPITLNNANLNESDESNKIDEIDEIDKLDDPNDPELIKFKLNKPVVKQKMKLVFKKNKNQLPSST